MTKARTLTRAARRREYYHILSVVDKQTGSPDGPNDQPAMCRTSSVTSIAKQNGVDEPKTRLRAAIESGDLVVWTDEHRRVCRATVDALGAALREAHAGEPKPAAKIGHLEQALREAGDD